MTSAFDDRRNSADPRVLLSCIQPREAALIDCAAGLHLRLRLGGAAWPPQLLYRVYTHSAVTNVACGQEASADPTVGDILWTCTTCVWQHAGGRTAEPCLLMDSTGRHAKRE